VNEKKKRIDIFLVEKGFFDSRNRAQRAIMAGLVYADEKKVEKPGAKVPLSAKIEVKGEAHPYVSRGGVKLEHALKKFKACPSSRHSSGRRIEVKDKVIIDIGASTGGFTDCLLQRGAKKVYAIDVGYGQLAWKLRQDKRVLPVERTNIRYLKPEGLYKEEKTKASLATIDVSFISLSKVLPAVYNLLTDDGEVIALVKPQFEAERNEVEKGGLITKKNIHEKVLKKIIQEAELKKFGVLAITYSPIAGADGNLEFFVYLKKNAKSNSEVLDKIEQVVREAHNPTP